MEEVAGRVANERDPSKEILVVDDFRIPEVAITDFVLPQSSRPFSWVANYYGSNGTPSGSSRARWGMSFLWRGSVATEDTYGAYLRVDAQEVSPPANFAYREPSMCLSWAIAHAQKHVTVQVEDISSPYLAKVAQLLEARIKAFIAAQGKILNLALALGIFDPMGETWRQFEYLALREQCAVAGVDSVLPLYAGVAGSLLREHVERADKK
jgi:hypothetical protein